MYKIHKAKSRDKHERRGRGDVEDGAADPVADDGRICGGAAGVHEVDKEGGEPAVECVG